MKLLLGFSVEKFYSSGMVLRVGDGRIKMMSGGTRHEVQSEEIWGAVKVSRTGKGHHHRSRGRNEYGTQRGTWSTTKIPVGPLGVVAGTTCQLYSQVLLYNSLNTCCFKPLWTHLIPSFETQDITVSGKPFQILKLPSYSVHLLTILSMGHDYILYDQLHYYPPHTHILNGTVQ